VSVLCAIYIHAMPFLSRYGTEVFSPKVVSLILATETSRF